MKKEGLVRFFKFSMVGGSALLIKLGITYLFTQYVGLWYFLSYLIATFVAWTGIFFANSIFTFSGHSKKNYFRRYITFMLGYLSMFWITALIVLGLTSGLHIFYLISIVIAALGTSVLTFFFNTHYVYHE